VTTADVTTILASVTALLSAGTAALAWLAKLRWSKEFSDAKEAQIAALNQQVSFMREMVSPQAREYFKSTKATLEEYVETLKADVSVGKQVAQDKDRQIAALQATDEDRLAEIRRLTAERDQVVSTAAELSRQLQNAPTETDPGGSVILYEWLATAESTRADLVSKLPTGEIAIVEYKRGRPIDQNEARRQLTSYRDALVEKLRKHQDQKEKK
jgi:hypothetical protein